MAVEKITYENQRSIFLSIVEQENRLSKCSKFYLYEEKIYELKFHKSYYYQANPFGNNSSYVERIPNEEKLKKLKEKFDKKIGFKKEEEERILRNKFNRFEIMDI